LLGIVHGFESEQCPGSRLTTTEAMVSFLVLSVEERLPHIC
jgi:hypothetical protein